MNKISLKLTKLKYFFFTRFWNFGLISEKRLIYNLKINSKMFNFFSNL